MLNYTTRIVLHDAEWDDYERLHEYMDEVGFMRTITSGDGKTYHLPDAEYDYSGTEKRDEVTAQQLSPAGTLTAECQV